MMRVVTQSKPRYPESLRLAGIEGHVLVQFKVDTLGMVDPASVKFLSSTHDLFSRAVREALVNGRGRFRDPIGLFTGHPNPQALVVFRLGLNG